MLNTTLIAASIPQHTRAELLATYIRGKVPSFQNGRPYVSPVRVHRMLERMGYGSQRKMDVNNMFQNCLSDAYKRGIFVIASRTLTTPAEQLQALSAPHELIALFQAKEADYFTPQRWYNRQNIAQHLSKTYNDVICYELLPYFLRHIQHAFAQGMKQASMQLITDHLPEWA